MANAIAQGARDEDVAGVELRFLHAGDAGPDDLLWADALLIGSPENFGYLSGMIKDFLDRTFYEVEGRLSPLPYAAFISAGNDGTGAIRALERIANGYPFVKVQEPLISRGEITQQDLDACRELGLTLAAGLELGLY